MKVYGTEINKENKMKLVKTASGKNKIKMSRSEWTDLGKKAGWMKVAVINEHGTGIGPEGVFVFDNTIRGLKHGVPLDRAKELWQKYGSFIADITDSEFKILQYIASELNDPDPNYPEDLADIKKYILGEQQGQQNQQQAQQPPNQQAQQPQDEIARRMDEAMKNEDWNTVRQLKNQLKQLNQ